eukprot:tig00000073_g1721.t1
MAFVNAIPATSTRASAASSVTAAACVAAPAGARRSASRAAASASPVSLKKVFLGASVAAAPVLAASVTPCWVPEIRAAATASFDVVSEIDVQALRDALDQSNREIKGRFDLKDTKTSVELKEDKEIENAKKITALIREEFKKGVTSSIQGESVRVSSKSKDDLQAVMGRLKTLDLPVALQFNNFR